MLYMIRASVYLLIFTAGYYLLVHRDAQPAVSRIYILGSFIVSLLLGAFPRVILPAAAPGAEQLILLPELVIQAGEATRHTSEAVAGNLLSLGLVPRIIALVSLLVVLLAAANLLRIFWLSRYNPRIDREGMQIVLLSSPISPFSFFQYVFVPGSILTRDHFQKVLAHEKAHWQRGHSWDVLLMEVARALFWFHPAWYLLNRELRAQHEYEADQIACRSLKKSEYQLTLLEYTLSGTLIPLSNPFNVSLIKKRIMMMNHASRKPAMQVWLKTLILLPFLALALVVQSCQQQVNEELAPQETAIKEVKQSEQWEEEVVFTVVETQPSFPGGEEERIRFMSNTLKYPNQAREAGLEGTVFVSFIVTKDGDIRNIKVLRGAGESLDAEAVRVIGLMPRWTPGMQRGQAVNVQFNMPIRFILPTEDRNYHAITFD